MRPFSRLLWSLVWLGLGIYLVFTLWLGFIGLEYPYQLDYGEGIVLWFARELASGHSIYTLPAGSFASSNYPPISMLLAAALMPIFGDGYVAGRLLNFASALIVAALIFRIVRTETKEPRAGALCALLFSGTPYIYHWVPLFRADLIGLAFTFGGVYCVWEWQRKAKVREGDWFSAYCLLPAAFSLFLVALYTKQTLFAAPAAGFLAIFAQSKRKGIAFALALGASGGAVLLAMDAATGGGFSFGVITSNATVFLPQQLAALLWNFASTFPILLLLALWGWLNCVRSRKVGVLEWYALISVIMLGLAGRVGAWENYFFEAIAAACVFFGIAISDLRQESAHESRMKHEGGRLNQREHYLIPHPSSFIPLLVPLLLLAQLVLMWHDPRIAADLVARDLPANLQLATLLTRTPGTILSEDMGALVTSGKPVAYYTFQYSSLARSGKWDQSWEWDGLRGGEFPLVILESGTREDVDHYRRFTREFVSALDEYYARMQTIGKFEIYAPAPLAHFQRADFGDDLALVGWSIDQDASPRALQVTIVWQAKRAMAQRFKAFVQLVRPDGSKVSQDDHEPRDGIYPTTRWAAGEMVRETYSLSLPDDSVPGDYAVKLGWYDSDTGDRLTVPGSADNSAMLTAHEVK